MPTPEFWNSFFIELQYSNAVESVATLVILYNGRKVDFAELIWQIEQDAIPNDTRVQWQINYLDLLYGENVVSACDLQRGKRNIKVAVVDDGIQYSRRDYGYENGPQYRVVGEMEFNFHNVINPLSDHCSHGTPCAGIIGALTNNETDVASIAGGGNVNECVSLYDMKINDALSVYVVNWVGKYKRLSQSCVGAGNNQVAGRNPPYPFGD